jgi:hypothetical protein
MARSGQAGIGKDWLGAELETVDRAFNECHFECSAGHRMIWYGTVRRWLGVAWN